MNTVLGATAAVPMMAPTKSPRTENYQGVRLLPTLCKHGWRCDFTLTDGSLRSGAVTHSFPSEALAWGKETVDTGRVQHQAEPRQFTDEPLKVRPFLSLLDPAFGNRFPSSDRAPKCFGT